MCEYPARTNLIHFIHELFSLTYNNLTKCKERQRQRQLFQVVEKRLGPAEPPLLPHSRNCNVVGVAAAIHESRVDGLIQNHTAVQ